MIPDYMRKHETGLKNFSLHFDKFAKWENGKAKVEHHTGAAAPILKHSDEALRSLHKRQSNSLRSVHQQGGFCLEITAKLATPYVSGLGGTHPTETGFILDRNTGLPYIPASAIKGVLRLAHTLDLAKAYPERIRQTDDGYVLDDNQPTLRKYFGDTDTGAKDVVRGQLVFLDAFPAAVPTIKRDIMTPHFGQYYSGNAPPTETENPIPVPFMSVKEGVEFKFRVCASPLAEDVSVSRVFNDDDRAAVLSMFKRACEDLGFGAKTAVGYGRMNNVQDNTPHMITEWLKIAEEEEAIRSPWKKALRDLENVIAWGDFRQKGLEHQILGSYKMEPEVCGAIFEKSVVLRKAWNVDDKAKRDPIIAEWLQFSGLSWPPAEEVAVVLTNDAGAELERIKGLSKWADYLAAPANMDILSKNGLKTLKEKLEGWGCKAKDAKDDKKVAWEEFNRNSK